MNKVEFSDEQYDILAEIFFEMMKKQGSLEPA